jgi:hypothetical protein
MNRRKSGASTVAQCPRDWIGSREAVETIALQSSQSENDSLAVLLRYLRTGGLRSWSSATQARNTTKVSNWSKIWKTHADDYLCDELSPEFWREYADPNNCDIDFNWRTGMVICEGEYRHYVSAGISPSTHLFTDVATRVELIGLHFRRSDIEQICMLLAPLTSVVEKPKLGRPKRAGGYVVADQQVLVEMKALLEAGSANSPTDAARQLARKASGPSEAAKVDRLRKRYVEWQQSNFSPFLSI